MAISLSLAFGGCATVEPKPDYGRAVSLIARATGSAHVYRPGDDAIVDAKVRSLLEGGLTADEAVEVALLNNPRLQASFLRIGMARADVVQSRLLSNPSLGVSTRFPSGGGLTNIEAGIARNIVDLWRIPTRHKIARRELTQVIFTIAHDAAQLATDAKAAYFRAIAAARLLAISRQDRQAAERLLRLTETLRDAGAVSGVDVDLTRSELQSVELLVRVARQNAFEARSKLMRTLGLPLAQFDTELVDELPTARPPAVSLERLLQVAAENRFDLSAARNLLQTLAAKLDLQEQSLFRVVELGVAYEREARDGGSVFGPTLSIELPIFDQNQAQIARAGYAQAEAVKRLRSMVVDVAHDVRLAHELTRAVWDTAHFYESELLPLKESSLDLAREAYRAGKIPLVSVLQAQRALRDAHAGRVEILRDGALARIELERATACPEDQFATRQEPKQNNDD
ncbi:MAG: TolC family protein [Planctomycetes bacterium]|nr:TolC family protein [Planctomycetota bacterium]